MTYDPSKLDPKVADMQARAQICVDLLGGTPQMRKAGKTYLPQWPQETQEGWEARRDCSVLFPAMESTIETMTGKPLGEPIVPGSDVPTEIEKAFEDIDRAGQDLDSFAREILRALLRDGITWVIADYPRMGEGATRADELAVGARPYLIHIPLSAMVGWRAKRVAGKTTISEIRYRVKDEESGADYIYKWTPGEVTAYVQKDGAWVEDPEKSGPVSLKSEVPVAVFYGKRTGFWTAMPTLEALAHLNVQHWQSSSDQRHILHVARVPLLAADEDMRGDPSAPVAVGSEGIIVGFKNLRFVEVQGGSMEAGEKDIARLEEQMRRVAGEMLTPVAGLKTATETTREGKEGSSKLRALIRTFEDSLEECLRLMALWIGEKSGGTLAINQEWDEDELAADLFTALNGARQAGLISQETYLWNLQKGKKLPPDTDIEQEKALLEAEAPPMGTNKPPAAGSRQA